MKTCFLSLLAFFTISTYAQTTNAEYNYITVGYRAQLENGLPNKDGYDFKLINNYGYKNLGKEYNLIFKKLVRTVGNKTAAIMIEYEYIDLQGDKSIAYYCIPHTKSAKAVWEKTYKKIDSTNNIDLLKAYAFMMTKFAAELSD